jgi:DNA-binding SARP family transcriptional activator
VIQIRLFGAVQVETLYRQLATGDFGGVKHRQILQLLVLHRFLTKAELAELLWEGDPPNGYVTTLESYVSVLRRRLDPNTTARNSVVLTRTGGYALDPSRVSVDLWDFDALLSRADGLAPAAALPLLERALTLAHRPLLADEAYLSWAAEARQHHNTRVVAAATTAAEHALTLGDARRAIDLATRATDLDPLAEHAWRVRISALHTAGDRTGALRCFHSCRQTLADELGIEPTPATQELFVRILQSDEDGPGDLTTLIAAVLAAARELAEVDDSTQISDGDLPHSPVIQLLARTERLARRVGARQPAALAITA